MPINPSNNPDTSLTLSYVSFEKETDSHYVVNVYFSILQSEIVAKDLTFVKARFFNSDYNNFSQPLSALPAIPENAAAQQVQIAQQIQSSTIAQVEMSLQDKVDPAALPYLRLGIAPEQIRELIYSGNSLVSLQQNNVANESALSPFNPKDAILMLMSKYKIDPFNIHMIDQDPMGLISLLKKYYTSNHLQGLPPVTDYQVQQIKKKVKDKVYLKIQCPLEKTKSNGSIYMRFDLYKSNNTQSISWKNKNFSIAELKPSRSMQTKTSPAVSFINNKIFITQKDPDSSHVEISRKIIYGNGSATAYASFNDSPLGYLSQKNLQFSQPKNTLSIFRAKSYKAASSDTDNDAMTSAIVGELSELDSCCLIISDNSSIANSVNIRVTNAPLSAGQISVTRRQRITGDAFGPEVAVIPFSNPTLGFLESNDNTVQPGQIYRYTVYYKTINGTTKKSVFQDHHFINSASILGISTTLSEFTVLPTTVSFLISTQIQLSEAIKNLRLLESLGISQFFNGNNSQQNFKSITHHKVIRTNLKNGVKEIFDDVNPEGGDSVSGRFVDNAATQETFNVSPRDPTAKYRYEVRVFLRDPSILLPDNINTENLTGDINRTVYYRPYKWRQPYVLEQGTLFAEAQNGTIIGKNTNDFGDTGTTAVYELNAVSSTSGIHNLICQRIDLKTVKVTWQSVGDPSVYDHFVVIKETHKKRKIIFTTLIDEFFYTLEKEDRGTLLFYVIPVLRDFSLGTAQKTNSIVISPEEMDGYGVV